MINYVEMVDPRFIPNAPEIIKACYAVDGQEVLRLLQQGHDVNALDTRDNLTCLHIACLYNYEHIVDIIIAHDEIHHDVDYTLVSTHSGRLAWQYASDAGHHELGRKVWEAGRRAGKHNVPIPKLP